MTALVVLVLASHFLYRNLLTSGIASCIDVHAWFLFTSVLLLCSYLFSLCV